MMIQSRWREHGSSGELDVFGATSYFAGLPPAAPDDDCRRPSSATQPPADRLQAAKVVQRDTMTMGDNSFGGPHQQQQHPGLHGHAERHATNKQLMQQVMAAKRLPSGKSRLAALLSFMVSPSPSPRASFRKEIINKDAPSMTTTTRLRQAEVAAAAAAGGKSRETDNCTYKAADSSSPSSSSSHESSSMQLQGLFGAHNDDDELVDLGVATGDRRLLGITVVRGGGGEERWVVRCVPGPGGAWDDEEEHGEKMVDVGAAESKMLGAAESTSSEQNIKDEMVEVVEQGHGDDDGSIDPAHSWDSDSSSDLFDLDLEY